MPEFIFENHENICSFLRGYFATDGCLTFTRMRGKYCYFKKTFHHYPKISFNTVSLNLWLDLQRLLDIIGFTYTINTYKPKKSTENIKYRIDLNGNENLELWMKEIGINHPDKFNRYLIWTKFGFCPINLSSEEKKNILKGHINPYSYYGPVI